LRFIGHYRTEDGGQRLRGLEELDSRDGIAVGLIDGDVVEGSLERLDNSATGRIDSRHDE
jgi:hypothetical protein